MKSMLTFRQQFNGINPISSNIYKMGVFISPKTNTVIFGLETCVLDDGRKKY